MTNEFQTNLNKIIQKAFYEPDDPSEFDPEFVPGVIEEITSLVTDTFLKAIPKKMKEAPGNIAYKDQAAAVKGAYNNAIDKMLINFEKELGIKEKV